MQKTFEKTLLDKIYTFLWPYIAIFEWHMLFYWMTYVIIEWHMLFMLFYFTYNKTINDSANREIISTLPWFIMTCGISRNLSLASHFCST